MTQTALFEPKREAVTLRPYQARALAALRSHFASGKKRALLVIPTGGGKTVLASAIIHSARTNFDARVLFVAHRVELIDQAVSQLARWGVTDVGVIRADDERTDSTMPVQVASIQTLIRRKLPWVPKLVFVDEAHRSCAESYKRCVFEALPDSLVVGLTATPCRADGKPLGARWDGPFEALEVAATYAELISDGFIVEPVVYSCPPDQRPDLSGVRTVAGDYELGELGRVMSGDALVSGVVERWRELHAGRRTVVFAVGIEHSIALLSQFRAAGVKAAHVDGTTPEGERAEVGRKLREGALEVVTNVGVYTEGWDEPCVKCIVLARPTKSLTLYMQMAGRVLRPFEGVKPLILDHGGNFDRHGAPHEDRAWSLDEPTKPRAEAKFKTCPQCFAYIVSSLKVCPHCGHVFVGEARDAKAEVAVPLVERKMLTDLERRQRAFADLASVARSKGYKPGYAGAKYKESYGAWPPWSWSQALLKEYADDADWRGRVARRIRWREEMEAQRGRVAENDAPCEEPRREPTTLAERVDEYLREWGE